MAIYAPNLEVLKLPNPPAQYDFQWMNQYTRALEVENQKLLAALRTLQNFVLPNYTTAQKNTLANIPGQMVFDTTLGKACINVGTGWQTITSV